jgi:NitT/TauT family transport system substrate-binding protein
LFPYAFASGTGDFVQLFEPTASVFEKEGKGYIVASFGTESGEVPYTDYMAKQSYISKNKKTIEKFVRALSEADKWVQQHTPQEIAAAIHPYFEDTDLNTIATVVNRYRSQGSFSNNLVLNKEGWNNLQGIMKEAGELPNPVDYNKLVNTSIAKQANK